MCGGPDVSSSRIFYADGLPGDRRGRAYHGDFIAAWEKRRAQGRLLRREIKIDVTQSPMRVTNLIKFDHYFYIGVQYSRGCPFTCEFCDIIELYVVCRAPKTNDQILAELQALYDHGYRGHVDFVDDNFIVQEKPPHAAAQLKAWLEERDYRSSSRPKPRSTSRIDNGCCRR